MAPVQDEKHREDAADVPPWTIPLAGVAWLWVIFAGTSLLLLLVLGAPSIWSGLYVLVSGLFAAAVLYIAHTHRGARVGLPTRGETRNGLATNVAILLAVLQLASGMFGLTKEIEARASARGPTTIIEQQVCPPSSHFEFPYERS